jgi:hypothetical protein
MTDISYRGHRFPPIVIQHAVWLYLRFTLSYRDVEAGCWVGTKASWSNPESGNSGSVKLIRKLVLNRQRCEEIRYEARSKGPPVYTEHYHFTSCLQPDGT